MDVLEVDQQLVVHLFAPLDGPHATQAHRELHDLWLGCRYVFGMHHPVPQTGLPQDFPATLPGPGTIPEALALQQADGSRAQAVLRRHHDTVSLSVAVTTEPAAAGGAWPALAEKWESLRTARCQALLGETRVYLALLPGEHADPRSPQLAEWLAGWVPTQQRAGGWWEHPASLGPCGLWETTPQSDTRKRRDLLVAAAREAQAEASALVWSRGDAAMPPLGRYLLHAARMRYQIGVWQAQARIAEMRQSIAATRDRATLTRHESAAALLQTDLQDIRRTVHAARETMTRLAPPEPARGALFGDDFSLADWFLTHLDDSAGYLQSSRDRARHSAALTEDAPRSPAHADPARSVFVIHGRDAQVRDQMFDFLRSLDLRPLEWESLVAGTGDTAPFLGEVVAHAVTRAQAAVVLLTPDDEVRLHPSLCGPHDDAAEVRTGMQPRANVLLELGMVLAAYPKRTILVKVGELRAIADLGGRNFIQLTGSAECRRKIASRLIEAGCQVDDRHQDWLSAKRFTGLRAYTRKP